MNAAVKLDCQSVLKAVEIHDPVFDTALAAKFGAKLSAPQQIPCRSFSFGGLVSAPP
jgi:hypothetical protein